METVRLWHCNAMESEWRLLTTFPDLPSAQALAQVLSAEGIVVRVMSDAGVLGQAAPARVYVEAGGYARARGYLAGWQFSEEELARLAAQAAGGEEPH